LAGRSIAKHSIIGFILLAAALTTYACSQGNLEHNIQATPSENTYTVDPLFTDFYERMGGFEILGPAISQLKIEGSLRVQYLQNAKMVYNPTASIDKRISFAPLGIKLGYYDPEVSIPKRKETRVDGGHVIFSPFVPLWDEIGGDFVGTPLTDVFYNAEKKRLEQHFENLGFFLPLGEFPGGSRPQLLYYGVFDCDYQCRYEPEIFGIIEAQTLLPTLFDNKIKEMGTTFVGRHLAGPYMADDGNQEVIFEGVVLYIDSITPDKVQFRPFVQMIGFTPHPPIGPIDDSNARFYPIKDGLGYNLPLEFIEAIASHGGPETSGPPISNIFPLTEGVYRQCFTNLCLDYYSNLDKELQVRTAPLGAQYKVQYYISSQAIETIPESTEPQNVDILLRVWEEHSQVTSQQEQIIYVGVFENKTPLPGLQPVISVHLPGNQDLVYHLKSTNDTGHTNITIPPIFVPNGTLINYEVCLDNPNFGIVCENESYLIWGNP
jgi:hypothetical protein